MDSTTKILVIGGGIGGLTTMLCLHARGLCATLYEQAPDVRELGVGINILPPAVAELDRLGLLTELDKAGLRAAELLIVNRFGQTIWKEPRGCTAGQKAPQLSIHRAQLLNVLRQAVEQRLGANAIRTDCRLVSFEHDASGVTAHLVRQDGSRVSPDRGDVLIAADGIHSTVRAQAFGAEEDDRDGGIMWRGMRDWPAFLDGRSMIVAGGQGARIVVYPIAAAGEGRLLTNWVVMSKTSTSEKRSRSGSRRVSHTVVNRHLEKFSLPHLDLAALISTTQDVWEYPIRDREPLPRWTDRCVVLLGDAAHPMYPVGSNGATQAILDARSLADALADRHDPQHAFADYESERRPKTATIAMASRRGWQAGVIEAVEKLAPNGFSDIDAVMSHAEREAIVRPYAGSASPSQATARINP